AVPTRRVVRHARGRGGLPPPGRRERRGSAAPAARAVQRGPGGAAGTLAFVGGRRSGPPVGLLARGLSGMNRLLSNILQSLERDSNLPIAARVTKGVKYAAAIASAPVWLRECTRVGRRPRTMG